MTIQENTKEYIGHPSQLSKIMHSILLAESSEDQDKEHFWAVGLTAKNTVKYIELVTLGILDCSLSHPREIFRSAVLRGVKSLLLCHNHPSGDATPSNEDLEVTQLLIDAGEVLDIEVLDHVIINGSGGHYSIREEGQIKP